MKENNEYTDLMIDDAVYKTTLNKMHLHRKPYQPKNPGQVTSFMPGNIQEVFITVGQEVKEGEKLCILEAMKMKNIIVAPITGRVKSINVTTGNKVPKNHVLIELG